MSDTEEPTVRKTRSGRAVRTPSKPKPKAKPGPASKKLKKKVVVMEVEVTDDEENEQPEEEPVGKKAKLDMEKKEEQKLLETSDSEVAEDTNKSEEMLLNSGDESETKAIEDKDEKDEKEENELILNDVDMLDETSFIQEEKVENSVQGVKENGETLVEAVSEVEVQNDIESTEQIQENVETVEDKEEVVEDKEDIEKAKKDSEEAKEDSEEAKKDSEETKMNIEQTKGSPEESKEDTEKTREKTAESKEDTKETKEDIAGDSDNEEQHMQIEDNEEKAKKNEKQEVIKEEQKPKEKKLLEQNGDPEAENISDEELPSVPVAKVPEAEEVSDEELPGPKRAELPADTEVVSEDELPTTKKDEELVKKEGVKRKAGDDYDPQSPTSENEGTPSKKPSLDKEDKDKEGGEFDFAKPAKPKKLPELDKYWKAVNDDPTDFTGWTYLLQYVDQENDMEAAREAYDAFLSHYPYCYGYWRKYADYEKRKGNKKKCEEVFERGLKAIPLSVDLWIHYLTYVKTIKGEDEEYVRSQFDRALAACGLEFRSDRLWDSYVKWETEGKRLHRVTAIYDKLLATPTQGYTTHFDNFQEHIASNTPNKVLEVDEFMALRKEVRNMLKHDANVAEKAAENADVPPGDEEKLISSEEETKCIKERIVSIRRKIHKNTVNAVTSRWNYEEGIKRPYFHVKPLERCQLKNWQDYLDFEIEQGDRVRIIVLFERCLIACALYEEFWLKFVHYLENLKDPELEQKIRDVYERACTIHHLKKPNLHLQWAIFEEACGNLGRAAEILVNLEKSVSNVLQVAYRRINLERRRNEYERCSQLFEHYISNSKNKMISSNIAIKYSRFCFKVLKDIAKAQEALKTAISKDPNNPRLYLQLVDLTLQKEEVTEAEICAILDEFLAKESADVEQKLLFAQRKLEYLEDFGSSVQSVQNAQEQYQNHLKQTKECLKKKEMKSDSSAPSKKEKTSASSSSAQSSSYGSYNYSGSSGQPSYTYSGSQQGQYNYSQYGQSDQYQYQNWQYPQGGYGSYNQWGGYGSGYGY